MPELPDIVVYLEALEKRILGRTLERVRIASPFLLRTAVPPVSSAEGKQVVALRRLGKRICIGLEEELWLVLHLMIAGRLHWKDASAKPAKPQTAKTLGSKTQLARFEFGNGALVLTEAGSQKRTSLHVVVGEAGLRNLDPGGREIFSSTDSSTEKRGRHEELNSKEEIVFQGGLNSQGGLELEEFTALLQSENHTLKRALTDPRSFSGIGNAYSDEILFEARLSPIALTQKLKPEELERLFVATRATLLRWVDRLRAAAGEGFPEKVTAFRDGMAVHGRYRQPCPRCGAKIQRIRYATNETNYCPVCQTGGRLLADRALSRLLKSDWPRTAEELE